MARANGKDRGIRKDPKGSEKWQARWWDHRGKERTKLCDTKAAARLHYRKEKAKVDQVKEHPELEEKLFPSAFKQKALTLGELLESYRPQLERSKTVSDMRRFIAKWTLLIGHLPITEVSKEHAKKRQAARLAKGFAPATINREIAWLKARLQQAVDDELLDRNPLAGFKMLPEDNVRDRFLLEPEEDRLESVMDPDDFDLVAFALDTGLRQNEQFSLAWRQVNFENDGWLSIRGAKGDKSRSVPLTARALGILRKLYEKRTSAFVFVNRNGRLRSANNFYKRQFLPAIKAAEIEGVVWHTLRHTTASRLALQGKSLQAIAQILGHSQTKTTERYAHLLPDTARATISALERTSKGGLRAVG